MGTTNILDQIVQGITEPTTAGIELPYTGGQIPNPVAQSAEMQQQAAQEAAAPGAGDPNLENLLMAVSEITNPGMFQKLAMGTAEGLMQSSYEGNRSMGAAMARSLGADEEAIAKKIGLQSRLLEMHSKVLDNKMREQEMKLQPWKQQQLVEEEKRRAEMHATSMDEAAYRRSIRPLEIEALRTQGAARKLEVISMHDRILSDRDNFEYSKKLRGTQEKLTNAELVYAENRNQMLGKQLANFDEQYAADKKSKAIHDRYIEALATQNEQQAAYTKARIDKFKSQAESGEIPLDPEMRDQLFKEFDKFILRKNDMANQQRLRVKARAQAEENYIQARQTYYNLAKDASEQEREHAKRTMYAAYNAWTSDDQMLKDSLADIERMNSWITYYHDLLWPGPRKDPTGGRKDPPPPPPPPVPGENKTVPVGDQDLLGLGIYGGKGQPGGGSTTMFR